MIALSPADQAAYAMLLVQGEIDPLEYVQALSGS